jgi:tetratricopeptide (TPR) repeat protein
MWTFDHRNVLLVDCGRLLGPLAYLSKAPEQQLFQEALRAITRHPYGKIGVLEGLAERGNPDELLRWVDEAENLLDENTAKQARGRLLFIRGFVENRKGAGEDAVESFRRSIAVFPDARNSAVLGLLSLYASQHRTVEYRKLRDSIFAGRGAPAAVLELDRSIGK